MSTVLEFSPKDYFYGNLLYNSPAGNDEHRAITYGPYSITPIDVSGLFVNRNYLYRPQSATVHLNMARQLNGSSAFCNNFTVSGFNAQYGVNNYTKASSEGSDNIMSGSFGADAYITRGAHVISGSTTIANGGIGGAHPYLDGVTLPSYVGATNPNDNAWVAGVLGLANVANLQNSEAGDPDWIEGAVPPPADVTPPSAPSGLSVD